jgi:hypothetical protein
LVIQVRSKNDNKISAYNTGKLKLYEAIDKRYEEIIEELKRLE